MHFTIALILTALLCIASIYGAFFYRPSTGHKRVLLAFELFALAGIAIALFAALGTIPALPSPV